MPRFRRAGAAAALLAAAALVISACSSSAPTSAGSGAPEASDTFPITITHALGTTTITKKPERVATVSWANHEVPLALGVVPVGMSKATWGDDDGDGVLPWVKDKLDALGAKTPVLFDETDSIDFEAVADTNPDVILAAYSGLTQEDYDTLSKIAPTIAYPTAAWGTSWQDMIRYDAKAFGPANEGDALIEQLEGDLKSALDAHAGLAEKKIMFAYIDPTKLSTVGFYTTHDPRVGFLTELGLPTPAIVESESAKTEGFYTEVSAEQADSFADVDVIVTYGDDTTLPLLQADPLLSKIPAIAAGRVVVLPNNTPLAASTNPTPLSIPWGISDYFDLISKAASAGA